MEIERVLQLVVSCTNLSVNVDAISKNSGTLSYIYSKLGSTTVKNERRQIKIFESHPFKLFERPPTNLLQDIVYESEMLEDEPFMFPSQIANINWSSSTDRKVQINVYYSSNKTDGKTIFLCGATFILTEMIRFLKLNPSKKFEINMSSEYCVGARAYVEVISPFPPFLQNNPFSIQAPSHSMNPFLQRYCFYNEHRGQGSRVVVDAQELTLESRLCMRIPDLFIQNIVSALEKSISSWRLRYEAERRRQRQFRSLEEALASGWSEIGVTVISAKYTRTWYPDLPSSSSSAPNNRSNSVERTSFTSSDNSSSSSSSSSNPHSTNLSSTASSSSSPASPPPPPPPRKYRPEESEPCTFLDVLLDDQLQTFSLALGRTNTEYFTSEPQFGANLHAAYVRRPHRDPASSSSSRLQLSHKSFPYSQPTLYSPYVYSPHLVPARSTSLDSSSSPTSPSPSPSSSLSPHPTEETDDRKPGQGQGQVQGQVQGHIPQSDEADLLGLGPDSDDEKEMEEIDIEDHPTPSPSTPSPLPPHIPPLTSSSPPLSTPQFIDPLLPSSSLSSSSSSSSSSSPLLVQGNEATFYRHLPFLPSSSLRLQVMQDEGKGDGSNRTSLLGCSHLPLSLLVDLPPKVTCPTPGGEMGSEGEGEWSMWEITLPIELDPRSEASSSFCQFSGGEVTVRVILTTPRGAFEEMRRSRERRSRPTTTRTEESETTSLSSSDPPTPFVSSLSVPQPVVCMEEVCEWERDQQGTHLATELPPLSLTPNRVSSPPIQLLNTSHLRTPSSSSSSFSEGLGVGVEASTVVKSGRDYRAVLADCYDWLWLLGLSGVDPLSLQGVEISNVNSTKGRSDSFLEGEPSEAEREAQMRTLRSAEHARMRRLSQVSSTAGSSTSSTSSSSSTPPPMTKDKESELSDQLAQTLSLSSSSARSIVRKSMIPLRDKSQSLLSDISAEDVVHFYLDNPELFLDHAEDSEASQNPPLRPTSLAPASLEAMSHSLSLSSNPNYNPSPSSSSSSSSPSSSSSSSSSSIHSESTNTLPQAQEEEVSFVQVSPRVDCEYPLPWLENTLSLLEELSAELLELNGEIKEMVQEGLHHRKSCFKKEMIYQAIPVNLHFHFFLMREHENMNLSLLNQPSTSTTTTSPSPSNSVSSNISSPHPHLPPPQSHLQPPSRPLIVDSTVTCGSFCPHGLGYKKGGLYQQERELSRYKLDLNRLKSIYLRERVKGGINCLPPTHPCADILSQIQGQVLRFEEGLMSVAKRRIFVLSQALTVVANALLLKLSLVAEGVIPGEVAESWLDDREEESEEETGSEGVGAKESHQRRKRPGLLLLFEGLLSVNGNEQVMVEDTDAAIDSLRLFQIRLVEVPSEVPNPTPTPTSSLTSDPPSPSESSSLVSPPPHVMIKGREVIIYLSSQALQALPPLYYQRARHGQCGAIVKLFPVLISQGIDLTQTMATFTMGDMSSGVLLQHNINVKAFQLLHKYCQTARPVLSYQNSNPSSEHESSSPSPSPSSSPSPVPPLVRPTRSHSKVNLSAAPSITPASTAPSHSPQYREVHPLMLPMLIAIKSTSLNTKNVDLLLEGERLCLLLQGCQITFCKSGKDRTGMAVTLQQSRHLGERFVPGCGIGSERVLRDANHMRQYGCRLSVCEKNTGRRVYAINVIQAKFLPVMYQPPLRVCEDVMKKDNS